MKTINKDTLIREISLRADFNLSDSLLFINTLIEILEEAVETETDFNVRGLGKLLYQKLPERETTDPRSKERVVLPETTRITFRLSKNIRGK